MTQEQLSYLKNTDPEFHTIINLGFYVAGDRFASRNDSPSFLLCLEDIGFVKLLDDIFANPIAYYHSAKKYWFTFYSRDGSDESLFHIHLNGNEFIKSANVVTIYRALIHDLLQTCQMVPSTTNLNESWQWRWLQDQTDHQQYLVKLLMTVAENQNLFRLTEFETRFLEQLKKHVQK